MIPFKHVGANVSSMLKATSQGWGVTNDGRAALSDQPVVLGSGSSVHALSDVYAAFINLIDLIRGECFLSLSLLLWWIFCAAQSKTGIWASGKSRLFCQPSFRVWRHRFKNMINIYVPAPRRWQPSYDEPRPCQGLLQPLFLLSNITQYDLTALQLL